MRISESEYYQNSNTYQNPAGTGTLFQWEQLSADERLAGLSGKAIIR